MHRQRLYGAAGFAALVLAACGGNSYDNNSGFQPIAPSWGPVSLVTLSDAERELGNISTTRALTDISTGVPVARALGPQHAAVAAFAAEPRAMPTPRAADANCTAGGGDAIATGTTTRSFLYFSASPTVNYRTDRYSNCANTSTSTTTVLNGLLETGTSTDSAYRYVAEGDLNAGNSLTETVDGPDANNRPLHTQQDFFGLIEGRSSGSTLDMRSNLFSTLFASQPNQPNYDGSFQIGSSQGVYEIVSSSTLAIGGTYAYASTACSGGAVTVSTPTAITLGTTSAGSGLPVGGVLSINSGNNGLSYNFNSDGSATLSGSVSGIISAADVGRILQNGTNC